MVLLFKIKQKLTPASSSVAARLPGLPAEAHLPVRSGPGRPGPGLPRRLLLVRSRRQSAQAGVAGQIPQVDGGAREGPAHPSADRGRCFLRPVVEAAPSVSLSAGSDFSVRWLPGVPQPRTGHQPHPAAHQRGLHLRQPGAQVGKHRSTKTYIGFLRPLTFCLFVLQSSEGSV